MKKAKTTKRALLSAFMALIMCVSMFVGTTYAWFTDSVTSANNKIVSGNLKLDLELLDATTGAWNSVKNSSAPIFTYENWEPGYTDVKILKVENEGSLALKWKAMFISIEKLSDLANVIDVYVCPSETAELSYPADLAGYTLVGTLSEFVDTIQQTTYGTLEAGKCAYLGIALKMQESAGNEYQSLSLGKFDIRIVATQMTSEDDSFGNTYDKDATYTAEIDNLRAALAAANKGEVVNFKLSHDAYIDSDIIVPNGVILNLDGAGYTLYAADTTHSPNGLLTINAGTVKNLNIVADAGVKGVASPRALYLNAITGNVVVENCTFRGGYALNVNVKSTEYGFTAKNCTFDGWTSISAIKYAEFEDCTFTGKYDNDYFGALSYSAARVRPYCDTTYTDCEFTGAVLHDAGEAGITLEFNNCTSDGVAITPDNIFERTTDSELEKLLACIIKIDGVTIDAGTLASPATLQGIIDGGEADVIYLAAGEYHNTIVAKSNITIIGLKGAVVDCINLNGSDNVTIKNVAFDAAGAEIGYDGVGGAKMYANIISGGISKPIVGATNIVIDGCTFTGKFASPGVSIAFTDQKRPSGGSGNITITDCTFDTEGGYCDIYSHYTGNGNNGYGDFVIDGNTFASDTFYETIYLGRYASSTPVVLNGNKFETVDSIEKAIYVQPHSGEYTVSVNATNNTFGA